MTEQARGLSEHRKPSSRLRTQRRRARARRGCAWWGGGRCGSHRWSGVSTSSNSRSNSRVLTLVPHPLCETGAPGAGRAPQTARLSGVGVQALHPRQPRALHMSRGRCEPRPRPVSAPPPALSSSAARVPLHVLALPLPLCCPSAAAIRRHLLPSLKQTHLFLGIPDLFSLLSR